MPSDVVLFWAVLAGLLVADNLVLVPAGADHLRFGARGRLRYNPAARVQLRGSDLVVLNPLNPFDRVLVTGRCLGTVSPQQWRTSRRTVRAGLAAANHLSALGAVYLLGLLLLAAASLVWPFGTVLLGLAAIHLTTWAIAGGLLLCRRDALGLDRGRAFGLAFEALVVPGYLVNLGKRVWRRRQLAVPGFTCGLRQLQRLPDDGERELYRLRMAQRLDELVFSLGVDTPPTGAAPPGDPTLSTWLQEVRQCLTTSAPSAGS